MRRALLTPVLGIVLASGLLSACETTVDPFIEDDRYFTIFGYLDTATDLQAVRVVPLAQTLVGGSAEIDATVTTTEVESGQVVEWYPEVITFADSSVGVVYRGPMRPIPGYTYQFDVVRSDGARAQALTTIPVPGTIEVAEPTVAVSDAFQQVRWSDISFAPFRVEVWYRFQGVRPGDPFLNAVIVYDETTYGEPRNGGWEALVRLTGDRVKVSQALNVSEDAGLILLGVGARLTMSDDAWRPPGGVFDREVLVQPGTFSNVDGGFGFLGAVNQYTVEWTLTPEITTRIGYSVPGVAGD
ncbi:MAG: hypothetical protein HKN29_05705 [Rhodothermales bacterium]|nr:hypothetical protein [Rhodothermales bacterium]